MRAGAKPQRGDGKTLAERLAETRAASTRQLAEEEDSASEQSNLPEGPDTSPDARGSAAQHRSIDDDAATTQSKPVEDTDAIVQAAKAARAAGGKAGKAPRKVCLVVDDSRVIRKLTSKVAVSLGYKVVEAENGEEALARCRQEMPELILTDWNMPVMSGLEFVTQLRAMEADKEPTVMFCTSKGQAEDIHTGIHAGADDYIVKPFAEEDLKAKLVKLGVV